jgi:hypothetical protein
MDFAMNREAHARRPLVPPSVARGYRTSQSALSRIRSWMTGQISIRAYLHWNINLFVVFPREIRGSGCTPCRLGTMDISQSIDYSTGLNLFSEKWWIEGDSNP